MPPETPTSHKANLRSINSEDSTTHTQEFLVRIANKIRKLHLRQSKAT